MFGYGHSHSFFLSFLFISKNLLKNRKGTLRLANLILDTKYQLKSLDYPNLPTRAKVPLIGLVH